MKKSDRKHCSSAKVGNFEIHTAGNSTSSEKLSIKLSYEPAVHNNRSLKFEIRKEIKSRFTEVNLLSLKKLATRFTESSILEFKHNRFLGSKIALDKLIPPCETSILAFR